MIWSPFSNLLLYGHTADVKTAAQAGVTIGIGSDWAPSGSKNVLGELKVAHLEAQRQGLDWSARDIVALATSNAAKILRWDTALGSLEAGKKADVLVIESTSGDPYEGLLRATETSILLIVINGIPRLGTAGLMKGLGIPKGESIHEGGHLRIVNLAQETADPDVAKLRVSQAAELLRTALKNLPTLAAKVQRAALPGVSVRRASLGEQPTRWYLALDEVEPSGYEQRPRLRLGGRITGADTRPRAVVAPSTLPSLILDPLTVAGDETFLDRVAAERVLPAEIASGLRDLY